MKKTFFGIFALALSMVGFAATAQTSSSTDKSGQEVCNHKCGCKDCKDSKSCTDKNCDCKKAHRKGQHNPFADLNLTPEQQKKIDAINDQYLPKRDRKDGDKAKADNNGQRRDREAMREEAKAQRDEYLSKIKEVLTPEQYNKFIENMPKGGPRHGKHGPREGKGFKGMRNSDNKGNTPAN